MKLKGILLIALCLNSIMAMAQEKIYMPFFRVDNIHPDYRFTTAKIFKMYVNANQKYELVLPVRVDSTYTEESIQQIQQNAKNIQAKYFIIGEMNALNNTLILSVSMYNTEDSKKVWSDLAKANTPDDLDPLLQKMANNIGSQQKASQDGDIYNVTSYDSKELNKIEATYQFGVSISGATCLIKDVKNISPAGFGAFISYDIRDVILDIQGDMLFGDINIYYGKLSGLYPFKKSKNTPFAGGSIGYGGSSIVFKSSDTSGMFSNERVSGSGLMLFVNGGYILGRNANVNMRITGSFIAPLFRVKDKKPIGFMLSAAIIF